MFFSKKTLLFILFFISLQLFGAYFVRAEGTPTVLKTINSNEPMGSMPMSLININGTLFFSANDGVSGQELWKSDGTPDGTFLVKDIDSSGDSWPQDLTNVNGTLFFSANDGVSGQELWKSDGTSGGTVMVKDINLSGDSYPQSFISGGGTLYFVADDGVNGSEPWKSDGTSGGTMMIKDINPSGGSSPQQLTYCNDSLFFIANSSGMGGTTIWKSDGTSSGTVALIFPGMSTPNSLFCAGTTLFFTSNNFNGNTGVELGKTDGTNAGTVLVKDINPGGDSSYPTNFADIDGVLYFSATDGIHGQELWKTDGTSEGTVMVKDINPGSGDSNPAQFFNNGGGIIYFDASDGPHGIELWKTDGTYDGTVMVKDINTNNGDSWPGGFTKIYDAIYFSATNTSGGKMGNTKYQLWKTDGTELGTSAVADIFPGGDEGVGNLTKVNNTLFFTADDGINGQQLWILKPISISISAPTKISNAAIINTTIHVAAIQPILPENVTIDPSTTAGTSSFICTQTDSTTIDCTIHINLSGGLVIHAVDNVGNVDIKAENGYLINITTPTQTSTPTQIPTHIPYNLNGAIVSTARAMPTTTPTTSIILTVTPQTTPALFDIVSAPVQSTQQDFIPIIIFSVAGISIILLIIFFIMRNKRISSEQTKNNI